MIRKSGSALGPAATSPSWSSRVTIGERGFCVGLNFLCGAETGKVFKGGTLLASLIFSATIGALPILPEGRTINGETPAAFTRIGENIQKLDLRELPELERFRTEVNKSLENLGK